MFTISFPLSFSLLNFSFQLRLRRCIKHERPSDLTHSSKEIEVCQKNSVKCRIFNSLCDVVTHDVSCYIYFMTINSVQGEKLECTHRLDRHSLNFNWMWRDRVV